jgi:hypothetical protein
VAESLEGSRQVGHQALNLSRSFSPRSRQSTVVLEQELRRLSVLARTALSGLLVDGLVSKSVSIRAEGVFGAKGLVTTSRPT